EIVAKRKRLTLEISPKELVKTKKSIPKAPAFLSTVLGSKKLRNVKAWTKLNVRRWKEPITTAPQPAETTPTLNFAPWNVFRSASCKKEEKCVPIGCTDLCTLSVRGIH